MTRFDFNTEEQNLICGYDPGSRGGMIYELRRILVVLRHKQDIRTVKGLLKKLEQMTDEEYFEIATDLAPFYPLDEEGWNEEPEFEWSDNPEPDDYDPFGDFN